MATSTILKDSRLNARGIAHAAAIMGAVSSARLETDGDEGVPVRIHLLLRLMLPASLPRSLDPLMPHA